MRNPGEVEFAKPGDVVQIDTLSISLLQGRAIKRVHGLRPPRQMDGRRALSARHSQRRRRVPQPCAVANAHPIRAVQIDGGSEFMAEFEQTCWDAKLALYVLPPRSPKLNGAVERCSGAWRSEFYACNELPLDLRKLAERVDACRHLYNHHRPHGALAGLTPAK